MVWVHCVASELEVMLVLVLVLVSFDSLPELLLVFVLLELKTQRMCCVLI